MSFDKGDVSSLISFFIRSVKIRVEGKFEIIQSGLFLFKSWARLSSFTKCIISIFWGARTFSLSFLWWCSQKESLGIRLDRGVVASRGLVSGALGWILQLLSWPWVYLTEFLFPLMKLPADNVLLKGEPSHPAGGNANWYSQSGRQCGGSPQKWNIEQPRDPAIALLGNYPKDTKMQIRRGYMHHDVYSSNVHSNQTVERIPKSMHWWVDKADGRYMYIMESDPASKRMKSYRLQGCGWI